MIRKLQECAEKISKLKISNENIEQYLSTIKFRKPRVCKACCFGEPDYNTKNGFQKRILLGLGSGKLSSMHVIFEVDDKGYCQSCVEKKSHGKSNKQIKKEVFATL